MSKGSEEQPTSRVRLDLGNVRTGVIVTSAIAAQSKIAEICGPNAAVAAVSSYAAGLAFGAISLLSPDRPSAQKEVRRIASVGGGAIGCLVVAADHFLNVRYGVGSAWQDVARSTFEVTAQVAMPAGVGGALAAWAYVERPGQRTAPEQPPVDPR